MRNRPAPLDNCEFCHGNKGGVLGNENVYFGVTVCDYCSMLVRKILDGYEKENHPEFN